MKKLLSIVISLACVLLCVFGMDAYIKHRLLKNKDILRYNNSSLRNSSSYVMDHVIDENTVVIIGSSELAVANAEASGNYLSFPNYLCNGGHSDLNICLVGRNAMQSLHHTLTVGALADTLKDKKVVFLLSPQWFTEEHVSSEQFASRFEEAAFVDFLKNDDIDNDLKNQVCERVNTLMTSDPNELERLEKFEKVYLDNTFDLFTRVEMYTSGLFRESKIRFELNKELDDIQLKVDNDRFVKFGEIDFDLLLDDAQKLGEKLCTTNSFGVYDGYFEKYMKTDYRTLKGSSSDGCFSRSKEYDDFKLFLDVCADVGVEPLVVSVPVNGRWYDYTGFPKEDRNTYYQNIREICNEYGVSLIDYADREYELYFLQDIMHVGWKGWSYLDEVSYNYYLENQVNNRISYTELKPLTINCSDNDSMISDTDFMVGNAGESFNRLDVSLTEKNYLIDSTLKSGSRSSVFLVDGDSGEYNIEFKVIYDDHEEKIDYSVSLEKGEVYKVVYMVETDEENRAVVSGVQFFKVEY